ncbi:MAG: ATP-binding cassette domain-containing protein, partial [Halobacteriaceae archaeon]
MNRNPYDLSGGQSQRVALASILALQPDILLLDEPTSQLDPSGTEEVFNIINKMAQDSYTVIAVSQDLEHLAPLIDRLIVLEDGHKADDGDPRSVLTEENTSDLFFTPDVVQIGQRLQKTADDYNGPIPLKRDELVEQLNQYVKKSDGEFKVANGSPGMHDEGDTEIIFEDMEYAYEGEIEALSGISLSIGNGCTCIIGQNGAGKSTFAKHLNGLLKPTEGKVIINGKDTREYRVANLARDVGLSFQNPDNQLFHSSVEKEVRYGPKNLGYDEERIDELTDWAIDLMDLEDVRAKNPYDLGLARRKRVAVASVLAMDTDVVVLDEPTGGQDVKGT